MSSPYGCAINPSITRSAIHTHATWVLFPHADSAASICVFGEEHVALLTGTLSNSRTAPILTNLKLCLK